MSTIVLYGYVLFALLTFGYAMTFTSFTVKLKGDTTALATMRLAAGCMYLLFCGLFGYLWWPFKEVVVTVGILAFVVFMITGFAIRPLLRVPEGDPRFGADRYLDPELQRH